eukprot:sb/3470047/
MINVFYFVSESRELEFKKGGTSHINISIYSRTPDLPGPDSFLPSIPVNGGLTVVCRGSMLPRLPGRTLLLRCSSSHRTGHYFRLDAVLLRNLSTTPRTIPATTLRTLSTTTGQQKPQESGSLTSYEQLKKSFWPSDRPQIKARVVTVGGLIVISKLANTLVPLVFKDIVNRFSVPLDGDHIPQLVLLGGSTVMAWVLVYGTLRALAPSVKRTKE